MQIPRLHWDKESPRMAQPSVLFQALLCPWVGLLPTGLWSPSLVMAPQFFLNGDPTHYPLPSDTCTSGCDTSQVVGVNSRGFQDLALTLGLPLQRI